jgi:bifunctional pyridoxal-dependent enzyme with beta-cystathionase and maltose regulon repressor activities
MEFQTAPEIISALKQRIDFGLFGYESEKPKDLF